MAETRTPTTADQLLRLPHGEHRFELVRGEARAMSPAGWHHGAAILPISLLLARHVEEHQLGMVFGAETGFVLERDPDTVLAPDVAFVRAGREPHSMDGFWEGPPDLAVEVTSPSETWSSVQAKALLWLAHGCRALLVLDPRRQVATLFRSADDVRVLVPGSVLDLADVVPGWTVAVDGFWPRIG